MRLRADLKSETSLFSFFRSASEVRMPTTNFVRQWKNDGRDWKIYAKNRDRLTC